MSIIKYKYYTFKMYNTTLHEYSPYQDRPEATHNVPGDLPDPAGFLYVYCN